MDQIYVLQAQIWLKTYRQFAESDEQEIQERNQKDVFCFLDGTLAVLHFFHIQVTILLSSFSFFF